MGIDIGKLTLMAARAAIGNSANSSAKPATPKGRRGRSTVKDRLPPAWPLLTGAAIALAGRAAVHSHGRNWLQALQQRLDVDDVAGDDEDREPELRENEPDPEEARAEAPGDDGGPEDVGDAPRAEDAGDEPEPEEDTPADGAEHGQRRRVTAIASPRRMSPVRVRKLAESARRAQS